MQVIENQTFDQERALYGIKNTVVRNCKFDGPADGESALKETFCIQVSDCYMNLRYPLWHANKAEIKNCELTDKCRAAFWYDNDITITNCRMAGIKALRECSKIRLFNTVVNSTEFVWKCKSLILKNVTIENSEYPFFEVSAAKIIDLNMKGKYSFQYCNDVKIENSILDTKDAFWHSKNVVIKDSLIKGEYLAWYSENLHFINCHIIGTQPFCYCRNIVLENCTMEGCDLSFERSSVKADIKGKIESVKNVISGTITADEIGTLIMEPDVIKKERTKINCNNIGLVITEQGRVEDF